MLGLILASVIGATIFFISTMLIFNTIRLTIHSRRDAIEIMRLVGATTRFIKAPFIIEGLLQGLIGGLLASGILWLAVDIAATLLSLPELAFSLPYFFFIIGTGMWLGLLGSYVSVGKYLQY
jgi:cell division transport system permease protein